MGKTDRAYDALAEATCGCWPPDVLGRHGHGCELYGGPALTVTTEQIVEAVALRLADDGGEPRVGRYERTIARACVEVALPLIRKQLADEVRRQCFTSEGAKFAIRQGRGVGEIQEFDAALEFAASLIEGVES